MTQRPIPPPFPFPEQWEKISQEQRSTGIVKWLVPGCELSVLQSTPEGNLDSAKRHGEALSTLAIDEAAEDGYFDETITLNESWAVRFSKTIKKMKQKVHKAKRKATWTKNR
jgi:hypothetical protein